MNCNSALIVDENPNIFLAARQLGGTATQDLGSEDSRTYSRWGGPAQLEIL